MKHIIINMTERTEYHQISGNTFLIDDRLERRDGNIYLDRSYVDHPTISRIRSVLLPEEHLWVIFFEGNGAPYHLQCYMHMAAIRDEGENVTIEDLYLDVLVTQDGRWHLVDVDEFRQALVVGELSPSQIQAALLGLENACAYVEKAGSDMEASFYNALAQKGSHKQ